VARVSAVIAALNEAPNLAQVLPAVPADVDELILVDGDSTDGTIEVALMVRPDIRIVHQIGSGKGAALRTGFKAATGDIIVALDADGSTDPREIPAFIHALESGADYAKGSRFLAGGGTADMPLYRKLGNFGFVTLVRLLFGGRYTDLCYGYNAFWARVLPQLHLDGDGFEIETVMNIRALRAGLRVVEVPSFEHPRIFGVSHLHTVSDGWRVLRAIFRERRAGRRACSGAIPVEQGELVAIPIERIAVLAALTTPVLDVGLLTEESLLSTPQPLGAHQGASRGALPTSATLAR
jgi:glycosyltransferase involved in cell wall biosynthesis